MVTKMAGMKHGCEGDEKPKEDKKEEEKKEEHPEIPSMQKFAKAGKNED
jgi:hypothetical protein